MITRSEWDVNSSGLNEKNGVWGWKPDHTPLLSYFNWLKGCHSMDNDSNHPGLTARNEGRHAPRMEVVGLQVMLQV